jgi:L-ribulokinase
MCAATVAGLYDKVEDAMEKMGPGFDMNYFPNPDSVEIYRKRYERYLSLGAYMEKQIIAGN